LAKLAKLAWGATGPTPMALGRGWPNDLWLWKCGQGAVGRTICGSGVVALSQTGPTICGSGITALSQAGPTICGSGITALSQAGPTICGSGTARLVHLGQRFMGLWASLANDLWLCLLRRVRALHISF